MFSSIFWADAVLAACYLISRFLLI